MPPRVHREGRAAHKLLDDSREAIAGAIGVTCTHGRVHLRRQRGQQPGHQDAAVERILVSAIEHPSVIEAAKACAQACRIHSGDMRKA